MTDAPMQDITIKCGEDFDFPFEVYTEDGEPEDLRGKVITSQLRPDAENSQKLDFVCSHNGQGGMVNINMPHELTAGIRFRTGVYDVFEEDEYGIRKCIMGGKAEIIPAVTR